MLFQEGGNSPFWMAPQKQTATMFIHYYDLQLKDKTYVDLLGNIKSSGVDISVVKGNMVGELQDIQHKHQISITNRIRKEKVKVYMGNQKVILQVLQERVFMETSKDVYTYYKQRGIEDNYGNTIIETILTELIRN